MDDKHRTKEVQQFDQAMAAMRDMVGPAAFSFYGSFCDAGFTPDQALKLTSDWLTTTLSSAFPKKD
jgi:hypothetical protein